MTPNSSASKPEVYVGLGEILWDLLPEWKVLGGAPANFAYHCNQLGHRGIPASRIGDDPLGAELLDRLGTLHLETKFIQRDPSRPTGTVKVELGSGGQPSYTIVEEVAWDGLEWDLPFKAIAEQARVVCFGSLAQRSSKSRETILQILDCCGPECIKVFDINLRQHYYSKEILQEGLKRSSIAKLNDEELKVVSELFDLGKGSETETARALLETFALKLVCVTRGANGSILVSADETSAHVGYKVNVADTIGAGDAFVAAVAHHFMLGSSLDRMNAAANRLGSYVAGQKGATPVIPANVLAEVV